MLRRVIVGRSKGPPANKEVMHKLLLHYYNSRNAYFTGEISTELFHVHDYPVHFLLALNFNMYCMRISTNISEVTFFTASYFTEFSRFHFFLLV
jgi:hypothetical protein